MGSKNIRAIAAISISEFILVGDNGAYFHSKEPSINTSGNLTGLIWYAQNGIYTADPYNVVQASNVSIRTIAFSTATNGVLGGAYNSNFANFNNSAYCYVRKIYDANRYSARFFYDKLGRLVVSQNARQRNNNAGLSKKYSYTLYDALGRVIEAGEKTENTNAALQFTSIFGTYISELFVPNVIDDTKLNAWITSTTGARKEVTKSYYDQTTLPLPTTFVPNPLTQRKRIVHVTYEENFDGVDNTYDHATHYDYDIHGNVKSILQDNRKMALQFSAIASQRYKRMDYRYDLVSGNVHRMSLQNGQPDQWHHAYQYDADNRITAAYTNTRTPLIPSAQLSQAIENELIYNDDWEQDASYQYYDHGPLARTEIGNSKLQGFDYVYNLQGWMKGINSTGLDAAKDPGKDGLASTPGNLNPNANFPKDVTSFSLQYFNNDYAAINNATPFASVLSGSHPDANSSALYNGNIRFMQTTLSDPTTHQAMPMLNAYQYDQLNRLKASRSYETGLSNNTWNPTSYNNQYFNAFNYDAMGNILQQKRHSRNGTLIDDLSYHYQYNNGKLVRNRLYHLNDAQSNNSAFTDDIDNMLTFRPESDRINVNNNYNYDEEGRLVKDSSEQISKIVWRVDGKIKEIQRPVGNTKKLIKFDYDAMGHRIAKHVFNNATNMLERSTYYILDAQGNQLSTYDYEVTGSNVAQYNLKERHIFGSSRLGMRTDSLNLLTATVSNNYTHKLGSKSYEFTNHLGNVLSVFCDIKVPIDNNADGVVDQYRVCLQNISDYSPFGAPLDGRTIAYQPAPAPTPAVSVVYQHKFDDGPNAHPYTTLPSTLDAKLTNISWTNTQNKWTNFTGFTGKAIAIDSALADTTRLFLNLMVNSGYKLDVTSYSFYHRSSSTGYSNYKLYVNNKLVGTGTVFVSSSSSLQFTGTQNVLNAISGLTGNITVRLDLFGGLHGIAATFRMDNFTLNGYTQLIGAPNLLAKGYRYGYQGSERDDELKGNGNSYTTEFRQLDPRVGRWFSVDPIVKHNLSPYNSMSNNPIINVDPNGADDYKIDKEGNISLKRKTNSESDKLIGKRNGLRRNKIDVSKGILNGVSGEGICKERIINDETIPYDQMFSFGHEESTELFEFLAKNSEVEWSIMKFQENKINFSIISTSHEETSEKGNGAFLMNPQNHGLNLIEHTHSHPGIDNKPSGSKSDCDKRTYENDGTWGDIQTVIHVEHFYKSKPIFKIFTSGKGEYTTYDKDTYNEPFRENKEVRVIAKSKKNKQRND